jgi:glyoxylase-like metal-dependent hydrolase (beta-lactamase superfamily II)
MTRALAVTFLLGWSGAYAADGPLERAAVALGVANVQSLEFEAQGRYFQFTQAPAPELPWPAFEVDNYVATLDYERRAVHAKYHRVQVQEPKRARPHAEATMDQFALNGMSWNLTPAVTAMPANLAERNAELWSSPQGFIKAALAHSATVSPHPGGSRVKFSIGEYHFEGIVNSAGEVTAVDSFIDSPVLGDTPIAFRYRDYRKFSGKFGSVLFPARIERQIAGWPWYALEVSAVRVNGAAAFTVPAEVVANPSPSVAQVDVTELAPGVWNFGGGSHNSVVVEQRAGIVVVEAPHNEQRSEAVIAKIREMFPRRPITHVINTHAHFDHAGGLRTYVAEGVTVVTHARNASYYGRAWSLPHTLNPDRLSKAPRAPKFATFTTRLVLADPQRPIEVHAIEGSGHNDAFAMIYLPAQKLLIEGDAWTPTPAGAKPSAVVNPLWLNLADNIARLKLEIERIQPLHGTVQSFADFERALAPPLMAN